MPNWCMNELQVEGEPEEIHRLHTDLLSVPSYYEELGWNTEYNSEENTQYHFSGVLPIPEDIIKQYMQDNTSKAWHNWCLDNWGTKWDISDEGEHYSEYDYHRIKWGFDTAWGPPIAWVRNVAKKYPTLKFSLRYFEPSMDINGEYTVTNEDEIKNDWEISESDYEEFGMDPFVPEE